MRTWVEATGVTGGVVAFTHHYVFPDGGRRAETAALRFRTEGELRSTLDAAGFAIERIYGGWRREPIGAPDGEFLVIARAV